MDPLSGQSVPVPAGLSASVAARLRQFDADDESYVPQVLDELLRQARHNRASDIHLNPDGSIFQIRFRIDGVLQTVAGFDEHIGRRLVSRAKVLAGLLTYRTDQPQEGRIAPSTAEHPAAEAETRIATFPTLYGERVAIRLFADQTRLRRLAELRLPEEVNSQLTETLSLTSGVVLLTGPSGSGKTTTGYACLRDILARCGETRSLMTLEDPIEQAIDGIVQSQVRAASGFGLAEGLRSMLRQDPDVILVGEIRDGDTAEQVFRAALTGHLVISTFHAGSNVDAVARLIELGIDPWLIRSTLRLLISQRLLRKCCPCRNAARKNKESSQTTDKTDQLSGSDYCETCAGTGYCGRIVLAECLNPEHSPFASALLQRSDTPALQQAAAATGMVSIQQRAQSAVMQQHTTQEEVYRILGAGRFSDDSL